MLYTTNHMESRVMHSCLILGITALGLLFSVTSFSQDTPPADPPPTASGGMANAFGVKGGLNYSTLYVSEAKDVNARLGGHFGLFGRVAPTGGLGIQVEALYDQKGTTVTRSFGTIDQKSTYKFDYITLPVLIVIPLGEVAELHGGGYLGAMIVSERQFEGDLVNGTTDPGDGTFNGFDYGLVGGLGINLGRAQIGARYNHGLAVIANSDASRAVLGTSKNASAQIYLALALGKGD